VEHDLWSAVPTRGHILCEETSVVVVRVCHTGQTKITDLGRLGKKNITCCVEEKVAGLQVSVQYVGRVDVFETTQDLVQEVTHMVIAQLLGLEKFVHVRFHQTLNNV
ncbi:hypothetical protein EGW08_016821, partial [Elysia chlorotica]